MNIHRITYNPKLKSVSLYFIGCNFSCLGCYWKQIYGKVNLRRLKFLSLAEVVKILKPVSPKRIYILSGQPNKTREYSILPKALYDEFGCEVRLLTNGYILPDLEGLKHACISIKAYSSDLHKRYTGKSNQITLSNFKFIYDQKVEISSSSVFIPDCINKDEIVKIAQFIARIDKNIPYRIIGYSSVVGVPYREPSYEEVKEVADLTKHYLNNVTFSCSQDRTDYTGIIDLFTNNLKR